MAQGNAERQASYRKRQRSTAVRINILVGKETKQALDVLAGIHKSQGKALEMVLPAAAKAAVTQQRNDQVRELIGQKSAQIIKEFAIHMGCSERNALEIVLVDMFWPQFQAELKRRISY